MAGEERRRRADAERNRQRVLEAAQALFLERGLDVGIAEIAQRAGVGRGTLFRNFASKEDLIAAIVVSQMHEATARGRELLGAADPVEALFQFLDQMAGYQQVNRSLFEAVADAFLANDEIRSAYEDVVGVLDALLTRAQATGTVRTDISAVDLLMLLKGVCEAASAFAQIEPGIVHRHLDLVRAALLSPAEAARPLRGRSPTIEDLARAHESATGAASADGGAGDGAGAADAA